MTTSLSSTTNELDEYLADRVQLMAKEAFRTPLPVVAIAGLVFYAAQKNIRFEIPLVWLLAVATCLGFRMHTAFQFMRQRLPARQVHSRFVGFALANGLLMGIAFALFMRDFNIEWQALITMFAVCLTAASIPSTAINARIFGAFALPGLSLLAIAWIAVGRLDPNILNWLCALIIIAFCLISFGFVRDHEQKLRDAFHTQQENKRLLERLQKNQNELVSQRDKAESASLEKTRVLAAASHDLRQPLHALSLYYATLALRPLDQRSHWLVQQSGVALESMSSLLNSLLDLSRAESPLKLPQLKAIPVRELLNRLSNEFTVLAQRTGVQVSVDCRADISVFSDPVMLERILRNLIDNALKHGARSSVKLIAYDAEQPLLPKGEVNIQVVDDGPGVDPAQHDLVFEEFFQANNPERDRSKGLGLGLAIVRHFCEQLQIRCSLSSSHQGSVFSLAVPRNQSSEANDTVNNLRQGPKTQVSDALNSSVLGSGRVLVVDSTQSIRSSTCALIVSLGFEVNEANSISSALLLANQFDFVAVITDGQLIDGSGVELLLSEKLANLRVKKVFISGTLDRQLIDQVQQAGAQFLIKPVAVHDWEAALRGLS